MLIFVHIPKTGGTSLRAMMRAGISPHTPKDCFILTHNVSWSDMAGAVKGYKVAIGHIPYGLHEHVDEEYEYVTVLRHPVERVMSKYRMPAQQPGEPPSEFVKRSHRFQNLAVRQMCGLGIDYDGEITKEHYDEAVSNLQNVKYIGFTRQLPELWDRLKKDYGFIGGLQHHSASANPRNNHRAINNKIENIDDETFSGILKYNEWDLKLYEAGLEINNKRKL